MTDMPQIATLDPWEAERLARAEAERATLVRTRAPSLVTLRGRLQALDRRIAEHLDEDARLHGRILDEGLEPFRPPFPAWLFWAVIGFLVLLEIPVNKDALDFLLFTDLGSWALATLLAILALGSAKLTGRALRQGRAGRSRGGAIIVGALNAVFLAALGGIAILRGRAVEDPASILVFLAIQIAVYVLGVGLAWTMANPDPLAEQVHAARRRVRRALARSDRARARLAARHDAALTDALADLSSAEQQALADIARRRARLVAELGADCPQWSTPLAPDLFPPVHLGRPAGVGATA